jgi:hypothetical protein
LGERDSKKKKKGKEGKEKRSKMKDMKLCQLIIRWRGPHVHSKYGEEAEI